ncbi:Major Facilitator Superfamily transporter [Corynebacterium mustelae]|uniref:Multidrug efflux pump Tap n=1 Tax=Corynebacterium mustelae TaxID=571915 RepID=A0A0G3H3K9_9CORY|nr:MFS transporter [Corynebacterium mustelae]AKK05667.1 Major Facilitator Superfamily transporter [Corynebacterium mustelae]
MTVPVSTAHRPAVAWLYLLSALSSGLGNAVSNIVWPWLVLQRTGDPAAAGLVATCIFVPSIGFAIAGGSFIDRFGRKPMSIISDTISALSVVGLIAVDVYLGLNLTWFIIIGIIGAVGDIPGMAARTALAGDVSAASGKELDWLAGANQAILGISLFVGPAVAGVLLTAIPISSILWITAGCSAFAALLTVFIRLHPGASDVQTETQENVFCGWKSWFRIVADARVRLLAICGWIFNILAMPFLMVLLPGHFERVNEPIPMGLALSSYAVGMVIGGGIVAKVGTDNRRRLWTISMLLTTVGFCLLGWLSNSYAVIAGMAIAGVGSGLQGPLVTVIVTENISEALRGRAFSLFNAINLVAAPLGLSITTIVLRFTDIYPTAIGFAGIWAVSVVWFIAEGLRVMGTKQQQEEATV